MKVIEPDIQEDIGFMKVTEPDIQEDIGFMKVTEPDIQEDIGCLHHQFSLALLNNMADFK